MAFRKHGVGEILGTDNESTEQVKTASVAIAAWTEDDQKALDAENREEEEV